MMPKNLTLALALGGAVFGAAAVFFLPPSQVILALCGVALLIAVLFFWNSLRTLGGDTDIPDQALRAVEHGPLEAMIARKKMLLLSLKDLDNERKLGKILPADFDDVSYRYREEVKALMRQIDAAAEPYRSRAEELAKKHLNEQGMMPRDDQKAMVETERETVRVEEKSQLESRAPDEDEDEDQAVDSRAITKPNAPPIARASTRPAAAEKTPETLISTQKSLDIDLDIDPAKLDQTRRPCPSCKASNEPDAKFCKECATPLKKSESVAPKKPEPEATSETTTVAKTEGATDA